jgi:hydrogenase-4 component F
MAVATFALPSKRWRPRVLPAVGLAHLAMTVKVLADPGPSPAGRWLVLDPPGRLVLLLVSVLFLVCAVYCVGYLSYRVERANRRFCASLLALLGMMSLVAASHHLGLMWVALEATTLLTAPLIYFNRTARSIEATWKYLLVGSVGIALALLGSYLLAYSSLHIGLDSSLLFDDLIRHAPRLSLPWLKAGFVLLLIGYGTKIGLAPMHTWKPDAYGEAPGVVGAVLAGGVSSCAFLALLRAQHILEAAGQGPYAGRMLVALGLLSMGFAAVFLVGQRDLKRMLAYSSVEHMGIVAIGTGVGGAALAGALLHLVNHGLTKTILFLSAANLHRAFGGKTLDEVRGGLRRLPLTGSLFFVGFLAATGSPPFAPFLSEIAILRGLVGAGRHWLGGALLVLLFVAFVGMGRTSLAALGGEPSPEAKRGRYRDGWLTFAPAAALAGAVTMLGLYVPPPLAALVEEAARYLGAAP